ncbi:MAG: ROK family protein [Oscillospiraceae bacterium]|nr:ROK family protein [Oscillospiraceae bacterium]
MLEQLKYKNTADILLYLFANGAVTKPEIVRSMLLGNSTVSDAINELIDIKLVHAIGKEDSIGGRRAIIYDLNRDHGSFVGVVCSEDCIDFVISDCHSRIVKSWITQIDCKMSAFSILLNELRMIIGSEKNILGIGIGLHGQIDYESQVVISCDSYDWYHVHLKEIVEREFRIFTVVDHCSNGAALREKWLGAAKRVQNYIYYIDTSPKKAAIILDDRVCRGKDNLAGSMTEPHTECYQRIIELQKILNIEKVVIATNDSIVRTQVQHEKNIILLDVCRYDLARGMATLVQTIWFNYVLIRKGG